MVAAVGRTATKGKGVCDYVGKSLLTEQARTRTHHAISSLRKNACAIPVVQVNIPEDAADLKAKHDGEMRVDADKRSTCNFSEGDQRQTVTSLQQEETCIRP